MYGCGYYHSLISANYIRFNYFYSLIIAKLQSKSTHMKITHILDALVILTGQAFFILLILAIGGHMDYLLYVVADFIACMIFMRLAHDAHQRYAKGYLNRVLRERERKLRVN
jgi:hypothetical protein